MIVVRVALPIFKCWGPNYIFWNGWSSTLQIWCAD